MWTNKFPTTFNSVFPPATPSHNSFNSDKPSSLKSPCVPFSVRSSVRMFIHLTFDPSKERVEMICPSNKPRAIIFLPLTSMICGWTTRQIDFFLNPSRDRFFIIPSQCKQDQDHRQNHRFLKIFKINHRRRAKWILMIRKVKKKGLKIFWKYIKGLKIFKSHQSRPNIPRPAKRGVINGENGMEKGNWHDRLGNQHDILGNRHGRFKGNQHDGFLIFIKYDAQHGW